MWSSSGWDMSTALSSLKLPSFTYLLITFITRWRFILLILVNLYLYDDLENNMLAAEVKIALETSAEDAPYRKTAENISR